MRSLEVTDGKGDALSKPEFPGLYEIVDSGQ
jgi:hypothetical protein